MKKIININLSSRLIPIEDSAYELLRQYLDSLKRYFAREEGADEIVSDIENRICEIFQDKLKKGAHCITDEDVIAVKAAMGTPEQFEQAGEPGAQSNAAADAAYESIKTRKRLYRDPDSKVLGGVCGGLGAYLNVDPVVFRVVFALLAVGGFGTGILIYFILWIATPEAITAAEKLEMRGEKIDVNNIKATVQVEINAMKSQVKTFGEDVRNFSQGRGRQVGNDIERFFRNVFGAFGRVIVVLTKGFFYFLAAVILLSLVGVGIAIAFASPVLFPVKDLLLDSPVQNVLFWTALFLLLGIPMVALIVFLVRKLTGIKQASRFVGYTLSFLWVVGLICMILLTSAVAKDFRVSYPVKEKLNIVQPSGSRFVIKRAEDMVDVDDIGLFDGGLRMTEDTVIIDNVRIRMEKSENDSFQVVIQRSARGRNITQARQLAEAITFNVTQQDSVLYLPAGLSIPRGATFRNQQVTVILYVPVNKTVNIDPEVYHRYHFIRNWTDNDDWDNWDDDEWNRELRRTVHGWENNHVQKHHDEDHDDDDQPKGDSSENNYRYKGTADSSAQKH
jgi:phage shock protein C